MTKITSVDFNDRILTFHLDLDGDHYAYRVIGVPSGTVAFHGVIDDPVVETLQLNVGEAQKAGESGRLPEGEYELQLFGADDLDEDGQPNGEAVPVATRSFQVMGSGGDEPNEAPNSRLVRLERSATEPTADSALSSQILLWTRARSFNRYLAFVDRELCRGKRPFGPEAYARLVQLTRAFLATSADIVDQDGALPQYLDGGQLPYLADVNRRYRDLERGDPCSDGLTAWGKEPFPVELIWSYWHEEGALVQTVNHILARFQNRRPPRGADPLARFDLNPLRPLRHILWGWAEDEIHRLTIRRRAAEYEYEYGLSLVGRAIPGSGAYVERRTKFLEAFHTLLFVADGFFQQDDDTTVQADAFRVLNALRETHLVLSEGAHNQFGDLPTEARVQMLVMQWLLAQPEMRDFLGGRPMVPYEEPWMDRVDTMKSVQGWTDTSVTHFRDLGYYGEQLLLSIRYGNWNSSQVDSASAKNWIRRWRNEIQRYTHSYRAVTGVDLTAGPDATMPALLLARRVPRRRERA